MWVTAHERRQAPVLPVNENVQTPPGFKAVTVQTDCCGVLTYLVPE
jgi:hypothetical protein